MSVRDLIWIRICQNLNQKQEFEFEEARNNARNQTLETFYLALADLRYIAIDSDWYTRVCALKGASSKAPDLIDTKLLPSVQVMEEKKEKERRAKMTPEELDAEMIKDALKGKPYFPH